MLRSQRQRIGVSSQSANSYRRRLLEQGVIAPAGRGCIAFAMPMLKQLLIEEQNSNLE